MRDASELGGVKRYGSGVKNQKKKKKTSRRAWQWVHRTSGTRGALEKSNIPFHGDGGDAVAYRGGCYKLEINRRGTHTGVINFWLPGKKWNARDGNKRRSIRSNESEGSRTTCKIYFLMSLTNLGRRVHCEANGDD